MSSTINCSSSLLHCAKLSKFDTLKHTRKNSLILLVCTLLLAGFTIWKHESYLHNIDVDPFMDPFMDSSLESTDELFKKDWQKRGLSEEIPEKLSSDSFYKDVCLPLQDRSINHIELTKRLESDSRFLQKIRKYQKWEVYSATRRDYTDGDDPIENSDLSKNRKTDLPFAKTDLSFVTDFFKAISLPVEENGLENEQQHGLENGQLENGPTRLLPKTIQDFRASCYNFVKQRGYLLNTPFTKEEADFPIAYQILIHNNFPQVERLLRAIWQKQNFYCIHVDPKATNEFRNQIRALIHCLNIAVEMGDGENEKTSMMKNDSSNAGGGPNQQHGLNQRGGSELVDPTDKETLDATDKNVVRRSDIPSNKKGGAIFMTNDPVSVYYSTYSRVEAELVCMADLQKYRYKYLLNLCGQDYPLKTNLEIIRDLKALNGRAETYSVDINNANKLWRIKQLWRYKPSVEDAIREERTCDENTNCLKRKEIFTKLNTDPKFFLENYDNPMIFNALNTTIPISSGKTLESSSKKNVVSATTGNKYSDRSYVFPDFSSGERGSAKDWYSSPLGSNTGIFSGQSYFAMAKQTVSYILTDSKIQSFLNWTSITYCPDEIVWATLIRHFPDVPGSVTPHRDLDTTELRSRARLYNWEDLSITKTEFANKYDPVQSEPKYFLVKFFINYIIRFLFGFSEEEMSVVKLRGFLKTIITSWDWNFDPFRSERVNVIANPPCRGRYIRKSCTYGILDLPWILSNTHWIANKFDYKIDSTVINCLDMIRGRRGNG